MRGECGDGTLRGEGKHDLWVTCADAGDRSQTRVQLVEEVEVVRLADDAGAESGCATNHDGRGRVQYRDRHGVHVLNVWSIAFVMIGVDDPRLQPRLHLDGLLIFLRQNGIDPIEGHSGDIAQQITCACHDIT